MVERDLFIDHFYSPPLYNSPLREEMGHVRYFSIKIAGPKLWNSISASIHEFVLKQLSKMHKNHSYWICTKCFCCILTIKFYLNSLDYITIGC